MSNERLEQYRRSHQYNLEARDRAILILLTSTFGFSFLAISQLEKKWDQLLCKGFLTIGWTMLVCTVIVYLLNFGLSNIGLKQELKNDMDRESLIMRCVRYINSIVTLLFILSLINIMLFVSLNLNPTWIAHWMICLNLCPPM